MLCSFFFFSSRRRHTRSFHVTGVQTCALPIWGSRGRSPGEFNLPWGIAVDRSGAVYVADWRNDRVQKFDPAGKFLAAYGTSGRGDGEFRRPAGVAVDAEGN